MIRKLRQFLIYASSSLVVLMLISAAFSPYIFVELISLELKGQQLVVDHPQESELIDGYWSVVELAPNIYAIGEPRYYQVNWNYLIIGSEKALLFDTGPGIHDISTIVDRLTDRPVTVLVSHLHFDHVGGIGEFDNIMMLDIPVIKKQTKNDTIDVSRYRHLGFVDGSGAPNIPVSEWIGHGETIDLGGRMLTVFSTPGHTPESAVVFDASSKILFTGDFLYEGPLYAMLPTSSRSAYLQSATLLLNSIPAGAHIYGAHAKTKSLNPPVLTMDSLQKLQYRLIAAEAGSASYSGVLPRSLEIDESVDFLTGFPWNNR